MDRKEAILRIKDHMEHHGIGKYPHLKLKEALDMAIAALSQQNGPLTQADLDVMDYDKVWIDYEDGTGEGFRKNVENMPAVLMRDSVTYRNAVRFGLVTPTPHPVRFYFEDNPPEGEEEEKHVIEITENL